MTHIFKKSLHCPNCGASVSEDCTCCSFCNSVLSVTACPNCFGSVFKGMKFCSWCGVAVERNEVKSNKLLTCPRCENILSPIQITTSELHECTNCGGLWLDIATFQKICDDKKQQEKALVSPIPEPLVLKLVSQPTRMYVPCPECKELMLRKNFEGCSGIIVDYCTQHGTWFDRQELQRIINFIKAGGLIKARNIELERLKAEQRQLNDMKFLQNLDHMCMPRSNFRQDNDNDLDLIDIISSIGKILFDPK